MKLDTGAEKLISVFKSSGCEIYAVGGCVRDSLLKRHVSDIDFAVSCTPDVTDAILKNAGINSFDTGIAHGTVTAVLNGGTYELTTYRKDGKYSDARHPDSVCFTTDLKTDLERRDFTVNAMAYDTECGIIDPFAGRDDLKAGIIRAVGDPQRRFGEDALRILRALRFAAVLDFEIERKTEIAMYDCAPLISKIARERITAELCKLVNGGGCMRVLGRYRDLIFDICPGIGSTEKWDSGIGIACKMPQDPIMRLSALAVYGGGNTEELISQLKLSAKSVQIMRALSANAGLRVSDNAAEIKRAMHKYGAELFIKLMRFTRNKRAENTASRV